MTYEEIERLAQTRMVDNWTATPIVYDNISRENPDGEWVRFLVQPTDAENLTIGSVRTVKNGLLVCDIYVPINQGSRRAMQLADEYLDIMENVEMGNTLFTYAGTANRIGDAANGWHIVNTLIDFQAT
jgi:hypothetical protein